MLRIGLLDTTVRGAPGSMARYRDQLLTSLRESAPESVQATVEFLGCERESLSRTPPRLRMYRQHFHIWNAARRLDVSRYDVLHVLDGSFAYLVSALPACRIVVTVHDLIPRLQMDGNFPGAPAVGRAARWLIQRSLAGIRKADRVCAVSQSTAKDMRRYGCEPASDIDVVPMAIEPELFPQAGGSHPAKGSSTQKLFHLGNNGFYKNRVGAIEVFRRIDPRLQIELLMAGPEPDQTVRNVHTQSGVADRISFVVDPDQAKLSEMYREAGAFIFPSVYEGFGWPPLEAMCVGCPVVSSDAGSLPEVVGQAGIVTPAGDYDAMARACERLLTDQNYRQRYVAAGTERAKQFSRLRLAERMLQIYKETVEAASHDSA
ncbi:glycosyltransferase family 4 protein [Roseiconus nitratireducens]|nr:glycosyltransferase family 1 protein [Roseiconus nitratireducens]